MRAALLKFCFVSIVAIAVRLILGPAPADAEAPLRSIAGLTAVLSAFFWVCRDVQWLQGGEFRNERIVHYSPRGGGPWHPSPSPAWVFASVVAGLLSLICIVASCVPG